MASVCGLNGELCKAFIVGSPNEDEHGTEVGSRRRGGNSVNEFCSAREDARLQLGTPLAEIGDKLKMRSAVGLDSSVPPAQVKGLGW